MQTTDDHKPPHTWWTFFPFRGIDLTDKHPDLKRPLFGDATLVSVRHVHELVVALRLDDELAERQSNVEDLVASIQKIAAYDSIQTFLAVQRTGSIPNDDFDEIDEPLIVQAARKRAYEIAALLAVVSVLQARYRTAYGLADQIYHRSENLVMLDIKDGGYWVRQMGDTVRSAFSTEIDESMSRATIRGMIFRKPFHTLTEIIITRNSLLPKSFQRALQQALYRLADSIHSPVLSAQLLGAVTTLEILFTTNDGEKYDAIRQRLLALLGTSAEAQYSVVQVLQARHLYVHQGREVEDTQATYQAVILALNCLLQYARACSAFNDKEDFVTYLDFVYKAEQRSSVWSEGELKAFRRLLKHDRTPIKLPDGML